MGEAKDSFSHDGGKIFILKHKDATSLYDIIDLATACTMMRTTSLISSFAGTRTGGSCGGQGPSVSLETGEIIEDSDDDDDDEHDIIGVQVSLPGEIQGGKVEGSRFLINDNDYRDYKFEAESPEMAAVWIHRIRLVLHDIRVAKTTSMKRGTSSWTSPWSTPPPSCSTGLRPHILPSGRECFMRTRNTRYRGSCGPYWSRSGGERRERRGPRQSEYSYSEEARKNYTGHARLTYKDGSVYEGDVQLGQREGQGQMRYPDGKVYVGSFRDDKRQGRGLLKEVEGSQERKLYCGTFRDDSVLVDKHAQLW